MRFPLNMLPDVVNSIVDARVSMRRLQAFLCCGEIDPFTVTRRGTRKWSFYISFYILQVPSNPEVQPVIEIENSEFDWNTNLPDKRATLVNINLRVKQGELVMIVGEVGSGKTSLLSALLGDIKKVRGKVQVCGSVAYVSQEPWIQVRYELLPTLMHVERHGHAKYLVRDGV